MNKLDLRLVTTCNPDELRRILQVSGGVDLHIEQFRAIHQPQKKRYVVHCTLSGSRQLHHIVNRLAAEESVRTLIPLYAAGRRGHPLPSL